jgi:hypothetical protein
LITSVTADRRVVFVWARALATPACTLTRNR